jgi:DNA-binding NtrC family response regulator
MGRSEPPRDCLTGVVLHEEDGMAKILIIDDEAVIRRMLRTALEREGHEVLEAHHGEEGIRLQQTMPAELVITDMLMPEMDGVEVIMEMRRQTPGLKIIAMSGGGRFGQTETLDIAKPLGAISTVRKPFRLEVMLETIERVLAA